MKYFKEVDLPVFTEAAKEMYGLLESNIISDIIDTIVLCVDGVVKINNKIKSNCCFPCK